MSAPAPAPCPFIAPRATEMPVDDPLVVRDGRLSYPDPDPEDWDDTEIGALWLRMTPPGPGDTTTLGGEEHPRCQRDLMAMLACQVCGAHDGVYAEGRGVPLQLAYTSEGGLLPQRRYAPGIGWQTLYALEGNPPVCTRHTGAHQACQGLRERRGHTLLWVRRAPIVAVLGDVYDRDDLDAAPARDQVVFAGEPRVRATLARSLLREIQIGWVERSVPPADTGQGR
ncbi:hypothetical protein [Streptomyces sp. NPDC007088]|uniref:hypothetical protein n=1 Tax=Streptomyces sp. NPDC007088 TaxID=3364773 RepID=UPI0036788B77